MATTTKTTRKKVTVTPSSKRAEEAKAEPEAPEPDVEEATASENPDSAAIVPSSEIAEKYVHRNINGVQDFAVLDYARAHKRNVLILGPTGCGKTMCAQAYAAAHNLPFFALSSNVGVDPSQLFGRMIPTEDGHFMWQDGPVTQLLRNGGVLVLDEINFLPERISTVLFPVLDARRSTNLVDHKNEQIVAHEDLLIVSAMNPGYAGTRQLNAALRNRFSIQMEWNYDQEQEGRLVSSTSLLSVAASLRNLDELMTPVSTNMLMEVESIANGALGPQFAVQNFIAHFDSQTEQSLVTGLLDVHRDNIVNEITGAVEDDEDDWDPNEYDLTVNGSRENPNPINHPDWNSGMGIYCGDPDNWPAELAGVRTWSLDDEADYAYEGSE